MISIAARSFLRGAAAGLLIYGAYLLGAVLAEKASSRTWT